MVFIEEMRNREREKIYGRYGDPEPTISAYLSIISTPILFCGGVILGSELSDKLVDYAPQFIKNIEPYVKFGALTLGGLSGGILGVLGFIRGVNKGYRRTLSEDQIKEMGSELGAVEKKGYLDYYREEVQD